MNICAIGDIHGNPLWEKIVEKESDNSDLIVFLGDYFDSFSYSTVEQIHNFLKIIEFKKKNNDKVILLIGNHDWNTSLKNKIRVICLGIKWGIKL
jgi:predicted MPP superfamily phosphohydrolase